MNGIIHATNCNMANLSVPTQRDVPWIFLSPHLDDAVFSCGGLLSYLAEQGVPTKIVTVFSEQISDPADFTEYARTLHARWETGDDPYRIRKQEDSNACRLLGAEQVHLGFHDCIYRTLPDGSPVVSSDEELFGEIKPGEDALIRRVTERIAGITNGKHVCVCPLGLGHHIDHQITRRAAEMSLKPLYYADLPYALSLPIQVLAGMTRLSFNIPDRNAAEWARANLMYASQISTFWKSPLDMVDQYNAFLEAYNGWPMWMEVPEPEGEK
ncbi:GlcNAc-PI de-N-acetylase [Leptolinea sp. HRD-7]|nr:GlcNAc-PI de-N-acetylase [Leptolinea sp. HRD-7]